MLADRVYWLGFLEASNGRTSLLYFAAAVPTVGFVHGAADSNSANAAGFEGCAEARFIKRAQTIDAAARVSARLRHLSAQGSRLWACGGLPERWKLAVLPHHGVARGRVIGSVFSATWQAHRKHRALARLARHGHVAAHHCRPIGGVNF
jgi:hypothetical protein